MSIEFFRYPAYLWIALLLFLILCMFFSFIIYIFIPKTMENTYFREPYFSSQFISIYNSFPMSFYKVIILMRLAGWPNSGIKRGIPATAHEVCPVWLQILSRVFIRTYLAFFILFLILGAVISIAFSVLGV